MRAAFGRYMKHEDIKEEWKKRSIYRVPAYIKNRNPRAYTPQCLSLGPYHHGSTNLAAMEIHKVRALSFFLERSNMTFVDCLSALRPLTQMLMATYDLLDEELMRDRDQFLELMLLDGVFLYLILKTLSRQRAECEKIDPVFSLYALSKLSPHLLPDIVMLENQIPLVVIERLIALEERRLDEKHDQKVSGLVFEAFFRRELPDGMPMELHPLDAVRKIMCSTFTSQPKSNKPSTADSTLTCSVMDLHDAGVKFECGDTRGISFENRTLKLPFLDIDTFTEPLFLNSIAFEFLHPGTNNEVSSYMAFMHGLIKSADDASLLVSCGTIKSEIGNGQAVADLIKRVSTDAFFDPSNDLRKLAIDLNEYYRKNKPRLEMGRRAREWIRILKKTYLKNPWTITGLIAAASLLILTLLQTFYTIKGYNKLDKS